MITRWGQGTRFGLEIAPDLLTLVRIRGRGRRRTLTGWWTHPLPPGVLNLSPIEPNIADPAEFGRAIRRVIQENRVGAVSVAVPDPVARVVLFDVARLPSQANDLTQLARWRLEKTFSVELPSAHFIHQRFPRSDGEPGHRVLASAIDRKVLTQYEQVLVQAGLEPRVVDLTSFHHFNLYRPQMNRLAKPEHHFIFLTITSASLMVMIFESGSPAYVRIKGTRKPLAGPEAVYRILDEVELSLNAYGKEKDLSRVTHLFVSAVGASDALSDRLATRFHLTVRVLGAEDVVLDEMAALPPTEMARAAGALGAALER